MCGGERAALAWVVSLERQTPQAKFMRGELDELLDTALRALGLVLRMSGYVDARPPSRADASW